MTELDLALNETLRQCLQSGQEGWLSEESADSSSRLSRRRVWVVDPLDGTREFLENVPEWCISVGLVEEGVPIAGGILNPAGPELFLGARGVGLTLNGKDVRASDRVTLDGASVLASRSEWSRGEWAAFVGGPFAIRPLGSVAYKLARVAAGLADATWTLQPKHEWDVAAGVALVFAGGAEAWLPAGGPVPFNQSTPTLPGLVAAPPSLRSSIEKILAEGPRRGFEGA